MNKLIWKGIDSSKIKGLLICELPPITKPKMRVQETIIDGVDGSIIEELGYESYDKSIKIGLTYGFDIDEVIKYFSGEGEVIFSNEPDKYYKAKIINRIDYERLLRFKEAVVKFIVQPFKYEYQEEETITATGSIEGINVKINDAKATKLLIEGRSTQDGEPTPDTPVEIKSVGYENLVYDATYSSGRANYWSLVSVQSTNIVEGEIYTVSVYLDSEEESLVYWNAASGVLPYKGFRISKGLNRYTYTFIAIKSASSINIILSKADTNDNYLITPSKLQIEKGVVAHSYIPYDKYGYDIKTIGKNKLNKNTVINGYRLGSDGNSFAENGYWLSEYIDVKSATNYVYSRKNVNGSQAYAFYDEKKNFISRTFMSPSAIINITTDDNTKYIRIADLNDSLDVAQLEEGSTFATKYEEYKENTSLIILNAPLRSLPNRVKDIAFIRDNKLYVDRYVGYKQITATMVESFQNKLTISKEARVNKSVIGNVSSDDVFGLMSNTFKQASTWDVDKVGICNNAGNLNEQIAFRIPLEEDGMYFDAHPTYLQYQLETPYTEEIGDLTILDLLDGENNISNSANTNMIIDYIEILKVNNTGNYISKPTFEIEGAGTIKFILNGSSVFTYNFDEDGRVVIDSEKEDAYLGSALKNRNMNGEFPKLEIGENKITWEGLVESMKVIKKSRWL